MDNQPPTSQNLWDGVLWWIACSPHIVETFIGLNCLSSRSPQSFTASPRDYPHIVPRDRWSIYTFKSTTYLLSPSSSSLLLLRLLLFLSIKELKSHSVTMWGVCTSTVSNSEYVSLCPVVNPDWVFAWTTVADAQSVSKENISAWLLSEYKDIPGISGHDRKR